VKVVLVGVGTRGDVGPLISVAEALGREGHEAVLLGSPPFARAAEAHGVRWREVGWDHERLIADLATLKPQGFNAYFKRHRSEQSAAEISAVLDEAGDAHVVVGAGVPLGAQMAAEHLRIPYRYVAYTPTYYRSAEWGDTLTPVPGGRLGNRLSWMLGGMAGGVMAKSVNAARAELGLPPYVNAFDAIYDRGGTPILAAHERLARVPVDVKARIVNVPAIRQPNNEAMSAETERYLADGEPPLYVGLGSMSGYKSASSLTAVAEAVRRTGRRALFFGALWDGIELPDGALRIGAEPHQILFPRVAAVVSHGGAGTVAQAAWAGAPQVVVAMGGDQPYWGRMTVAAGVSPASFALATVAARALEEAIDAATGGPCVTRARELAAEVAGTDGADDVAREIMRGR
jgi:vancomycin aglycone glucosyltransferase